MNEELKELYYRDDVVIGSKQNFINIAKKSLNASTKEINEFMTNQEINEFMKLMNLWHLENYDVSWRKDCFKRKKTP